MRLESAVFTCGWVGTSACRRRHSGPVPCSASSPILADEAHGSERSFWTRRTRRHRGRGAMTREGGERGGEQLAQAIGELDGRLPAHGLRNLYTRHGLHAVQRYADVRGPIRSAIRRPVAEGPGGQRGTHSLVQFRHGETAVGGGRAQDVHGGVPVGVRGPLLRRTEQRARGQRPRWRKASIRPWRGGRWRGRRPAAGPPARRRRRSGPGRSGGEDPLAADRTPSARA